MCTLTIRFNLSDNYPLVVVANRDEFYTRPSTPPSIIEKNPAIFAPKDLEAGGTWFGVNEWGLVAAITNVWLPRRKKTHQNIQPTRSRGLLTLDALRCKNMRNIRQIIPQKIIEDNYQPFNLLVASTSTAVVFTYTGELREYILTAKGTTILNTPYSPPKAVPDELPPFPADNGNQNSSVDEWLQTIQQFLSQHPDFCKHSYDFGTRSAQVLVLGKRLPRSFDPLFPDRFWYADGPPCETDFVDLSAQLQANRQRTVESAKKIYD